MDLKIKSLKESPFKTTDDVRSTCGDKLVLANLVLTKGNIGHGQSS